MALLVAVLSLFGLYAPERLTQMVSGAVAQPWGIHLAVGVRLVLGTALLAVAAASRFPAVFEALGWVTLAAAIGLMFLGRTRLRSFVAWIGARPVSIIRAWLACGALLGGFLAYGVS